MTIVSPAMVLGKPVVDERGSAVGSVVDVGVHDLGRVKFLLVGKEAWPERLVRVPVTDVERVDRAHVTLKRT